MAVVICFRLLRGGSLKLFLCFEIQTTPGNHNFKPVNDVSDIPVL